MKCRGEKTRIGLVQKYELTPFAHFKLLNGQNRKSCTGDALTDSYYCFSYKSRRGDEAGSFLCGSHAARHFLALLNLEDIPLFNPLKHESGSNSYSGGKKYSQEKKWNEKAKQLYNAMNLLVVCWGIVPRGPLKSIMEKISRYRNKNPFPSQIKSVNKIVSKDCKGRTLRKMLEELSQQNNLREFSFDELNKELKKNNIPSHFG